MHMRSDEDNIRNVLAIANRSLRSSSTSGRPADRPQCPLSPGIGVEIALLIGRVQRGIP